MLVLRRCEYRNRAAAFTLLVLMHAQPATALDVQSSKAYVASAQSLDTLRTRVVEVQNDTCDRERAHPYFLNVKPLLNLALSAGRVSFPLRRSERGDWLPAAIKAPMTSASRQAAS